MFQYNLVKEHVNTGNISFYQKGMMIESLLLLDYYDGCGRYINYWYQKAN
jgi:hypothetical protein